MSQTGEALKPVDITNHLPAEVEYLTAPSPSFMSVEDFMNYVIGGNTFEQTGVEVAQALPSSGTLITRTEVRNANNDETIATLESGTEVEILGTDSSTIQSYYWIRYVYENGDEIQGWIPATNIDIETDLTNPIDVATPPSITFRTPEGEVTATPVPATELPQLQLLELPVPDPTSTVVATRDASGNIQDIYSKGQFDITPRWKWSFERQRWSDLHGGRPEYERALPGGNTHRFFSEFGNVIVGWNEEMKAYERNDGALFYPRLGTGQDYDLSDLSEGWVVTTEHLVSSNFVLGSEGIDLTINVSTQNQDFSRVTFNPALLGGEIDNIQQYLEVLNAEVPGLQGKKVIANFAANDVASNRQYNRGNGAVSMYVPDGFSSGFSRLDPNTIVLNISISTTFQGRPRSSIETGTAVGFSIEQTARWSTAQSKPGQDFDDFNIPDLIFDGEALQNTEPVDKYITTFVVISESE